MVLIDVKALSHTYEGRVGHALNNVNFHVNKGEWVSIVGHNGSGKSTLVKLLGGILPIEHGEVWIDGLQVNAANSHLLHTKMGMVFQNPDNQFVGATVEDDVAFGLENNGVPYEEMHRRVDEVLAQVGMSPFKTHEPHHLSGGQKQRVAIAGVIALRPQVIILDEATAMLDPEGRIEMIQLIRELQQRLNLTVLAITHDLDETVHADRLLVLDKGQLVLEGAPAEVFNQGEQLIELGLNLPFSMKMNYLIDGRMEFLNDEELLRSL